MRLRLFLLLGLVTVLVAVVVNGAKSTDDEHVEGSANVQNPDDEDFEEEESSGLPPDDDDKKEEQVKDIKDSRDHLPPNPTQSPTHATTVILKSGKVNTAWSLDSSTIAILFGVFVLVVFLIIVGIIVCRKKSRKAEYTRGTRQSNQYV